MSDEAERSVLVAGAGVVGLALAFELARAGWRVTVCDPEPPGSQCSRGNAGAISAGSVAPLAMPGVMRSAFSMLLDSASALHIPFRYWLRAAPWLTEFARAARPGRVRHIAQALEGLLAGSLDSHARLAREVGCPELIRRNGQLHVYPDRRAYDKDRGSWELKRAHGQRMECVQAGEIRELEPAVSERYRYGVLLPDEGWVAEPQRYTQAIAAALQAMDVPIVRAGIASLRRDGGAWTASDGARDWRAGRVVVAAGAWSRPLLAAQGHDVPLESQRGYHLQARDAGVSLSRVTVLADRKVFVTPMESGLRIAGTVEFGGLERPPSARRAMLLGDHARAGFRGLRLEQPSIWMGHRPCLPDSMPVLGPVPDRPGLWCAFGHGHLGLTGSANTARLLAAAMAGRGDERVLAPFSIGRFAS